MYLLLPQQHILKQQGEKLRDVEWNCDCGEQKKNYGEWSSSIEVIDEDIKSSP
jgi:hypothetical protein